MLRVPVLVLWLLTAACLFLGQQSAFGQGQSAEEQTELAEAARLNREAIQLFGEQKLRDALVLAKRALAIRERILGKNHKDTASSYNNVGTTSMVLGDLEAAEPYLDVALEIRVKLYGEEHADTASSHNERGHLDYRRQNYDAARKHYERALQTRRKVLGEEHALTGEAWHFVGDAARKQSDFASARTAYERAAVIRAKALGEANRLTADSLYWWGISSSSMRDYAAAVAPLERALATRRKLLGEEAVLTARTRYELGLALKGISQFAKARAQFEAALKVIQAALSEDDLDVAWLRFHLAYCLAELELYAEARPYLARTLQTVRKVKGEEHADTFTVREEIVWLLKKCDPPAALTAAEELVRLRRKVNGEDDPTTAAALFDLGQTLEYFGRLTEARDCLEQSVKIRQQTLGKDHVETAASLHDLGNVLRGLGDYPRARTALESALAIRKEKLGYNNNLTAETIERLGLVAQLEGDLNQARQQYEQALAIQQKVNGEEHNSTGSARYRLGTLLMDLGDYAAARPHLEKALSVFIKVRGPEDVNVAAALHSLGMWRADQGDYPGAAANFERAVQIFRKRYGEDHVTTAAGLVQLGVAQQRRGDSAAAKANFEQALKITEKALGPDHQDTLASAAHLGYLLAQQGDYVAARANYERYHGSLKKTLGPDHLLTINSLALLGDLLCLQGDDAAALPVLKEAVRQQRAKLGENNPRTIDSFRALARVTARQEDWSQALEFQDQERRRARHHVLHVMPALSQREQLQYLTNLDWQLHSALSLGLKRAEDSTAVALSASWLMNGKGTAQETLAARTLLFRDIKNPNLAQSVAEIDGLRKRLASLAMSAPTPGKEQSRQDELAKLTDEEQTLARRLAAAIGKPAIENAWVELADVRQAIPANAVLIDIAHLKLRDFQANGNESNWMGARYAAWIIPPLNQRDVRLVDLGPAEELDAAVEAARQAVADGAKADGALRRDGEVVAESQARRALERISDLVWKPLAGHVSDAEELLISPDGQLWLLPWGALPVGDNQCLLERCALRLVVSARELLNRASNPQKTTVPLIFADPDFDLNAESAKQALAAVFPSAQMSGEQARSAELTRSAFSRVAALPYTEIEAQTAKPNISRFAGLEPITYSKRYALESIAKRVTKPKVLMFATHGFFLQDQVAKAEDASALASATRSAALTVSGAQLENPLLRCGLLMAGCNQAQTSGDDGVLTGLEIVSLDLRGTELVVLSACETGIGKVHNGEGVAGLRQAFQLAGASSVVSTLWQVPDRDSALLMNDFFINLAEGQSKAAALRNAQLKRIASRRDKFGAAHPFFWAAWTITGHN